MVGAAARRRITGKLFELGPGALRREPSGRLQSTAVEAVELQRIDPEAERRQLARTARVRAERNAEAAAAALEAVGATARGDANLLPPMREALVARCTVGEICEVLRDEFGTYDARHA